MSDSFSDVAETCRRNLRMLKAGKNASLKATLTLGASLKH